MNPSSAVKAPCVAILGPPNSGKTTLLHLLDAALQARAEAPWVYVVKGNPDGTGRYLYYVPEERDNLKPLVKGQWTPRTVEMIRQWVNNARENLELALLDFGGKHDEANRSMLECCSHYLVLSRHFDDPAKETKEGMDSWAAVAEKAGLKCVAKIESLWLEGAPSADSSVPMAGTFRSDASRPADRMNRVLIDALTERLMTLRLHRDDRPRYTDLRLGRRWEERDLATLGGRLAQLQEVLRKEQHVWLGGDAPIWAYAAAMHHGLDLDPGAEVSIYDPKVPGAMVIIPKELQSGLPGFPSGAVRFGWERRPDELALLIRTVTPDKFISMDAVLTLPRLPLQEDPAHPIKAQNIVIDGPGPIWLHLTLSRWLRNRGAARIAHWDATYQRPFTVWPLK